MLLTVQVALLSSPLLAFLPGGWDVNPEGSALLRPKRFNTGKRKVLPLGRDEPRPQHMWRAGRLESSQGKVAMLLPSSAGFLPALPEAALALPFLLLRLERTPLWQMLGTWMPSG